MFIKVELVKEVECLDLVYPECPECPECKKAIWKWVDLVKVN